jgi:hypothetical protein
LTDVREAQADLTIDVQILMSASELGDMVNADVSRALLEYMLLAPSARLVMDTGGLIEQQYSDKTGTAFGASWVRLMGSRSKIVYVERASVDRGARTELNEAGFRISHEDFKHFVRTAAAASSKILVTHDPHFAGVRRILRRRLGVSVSSASEARAGLAAC